MREVGGIPTRQRNEAVRKRPLCLSQILIERFACSLLYNCKYLMLCVSPYLKEEVAFWRTRAVEK
jgi:hypothetical protein